MTTGATATPITIPTAVTRPATDVRQHQRPASRSCHTRNKSRVVFAGPVPIGAALAGCMGLFSDREQDFGLDHREPLPRVAGVLLRLYARWPCSLKIEFSFLNCNLMVPGGSSAYLLVDDQRQPIKPLEVLMKRYLGAVAAAALLVGTMAVATDALAAGHGGGGGFGGGHMGGGFRGPLLESVPSMPPPVFNPSSPYTVPASPETPVSPASPGSVFGNG